MQEELKMIEYMENDDKWFNINFDSIQDEHRNEFVAISKRKLVASGKNTEELFNEIKKKRLDPKKLLIEFVPEKGLVVVL